MTSTDNKPTPTPRLSHVLETCLYVRSAPKSAEFYQRVFDIKPDFVTERMASLPLATSTLLLFTLGLTAAASHSPLGTIAGHGPSPQILELLRSAGSDSLISTETTRPKNLGQHFCLATETVDDVKAWELRLKEQGVKILGVREWERGGRSVYFEDLDGCVGEVGSRGIWRHW